MSPARNTFNEESSAYANARPRYPAALFAWLAERCPNRDAAWDCATGNGQAAVGLAPYFKVVHATDVSAEQIAHAWHRGNILYSVASAERTELADGSYDLIAVAQALQWFDFARFWPEVSRVARHGALFCAWGYAWPESTPRVDQELVEPFRQIVAPFWPPNNQIVWEGYRDADIEFPFARLETPDLAIETEWTVAQLVNYLKTWSAYKIGRSDSTALARMDALIANTRTLAPVDSKLRIRMPLTIVAGHVP